MVISVFSRVFVKSLLRQPIRETEPCGSLSARCLGKAPNRPRLYCIREDDAVIEAFLAMAGGFAVFLGGRKDFAGGQCKSPVGKSAGLPQMVFRACA